LRDRICSIDWEGQIVINSSLDMQPVRPAAGAGWQFAVFRAWRERDHPRASYVIASHVWRREQRLQADDASESARGALKNWEPRLTGVAYSDRSVFLVEVIAKLTAEHVGRMMYLADLFRADPDYAAHRCKSAHRVMLVREAEPSVFEFARRKRVRVIVWRSGADTDSSHDADRKHQEAAAPAGTHD
jgi:hypothetical protein